MLVSLREFRSIFIDELNEIMMVISIIHLQSIIRNLVLKMALVHLINALRFILTKNVIAR